MSDGIRLICRRVAHHSAGSGYDRLADYLDAGSLHTPTESGRALARLVSPLLNRSGTRWYGVGSLLGELGAAREARKSRRLFHFLYGENDYRLLGALKPVLDCSIVATFHQVPSVFKQVVRFRRYLRRLDGVIVLSSEQLDFFADMLGEDKVFLVPHGIDTDIFRPGVGRRAGGTCLFVGQWLRDFDGMVDIVNESALTGAGIRFNIITGDQHTSRFKGLPNTSVSANVSQAELLRAYQNADLLLLPMIDCTANNAVLEALACALPVVTTDVGGMSDYLNADCGILMGREVTARQSVEQICALISDKKRLKLMSRAARLRALELDWREVARGMRDVYARLSI